MTYQVSRITSIWVQWWSYCMSAESIVLLTCGKVVRRFDFRMRMLFGEREGGGILRCFSRPRLVSSRPHISPLTRIVRRLTIWELKSVHRKIYSGREWQRICATPAYICWKLRAIIKRHFLRYRVSWLKKKNSVRKNAIFNAKKKSLYAFFSSPLFSQFACKSDFVYSLFTIVTVDIVAHGWTIKVKVSCTNVSTVQPAYGSCQLRDVLAWIFIGLQLQ